MWWTHSVYDIWITSHPPPHWTTTPSHSEQWLIAPYEQWIIAPIWTIPQPPHINNDSPHMNNDSSSKQWHIPWTMNHHKPAHCLNRFSISPSPPLILSLAYSFISHRICKKGCGCRPMFNLDRFILYIYIFQVPIKIYHSWILF